MEKVIPKTLKRIETYQTSLYRNGVLSRFQKMTKGHLKLEIEGDNYNYSFGYGNKVQAHLKIINSEFFYRLMRSGEVGFGESYVEGDWYSDNLVELIKWFLINNKSDESSRETSLFSFLESVHKIQNFLHQEKYSSFDQNISFHYDLGTRFFSKLLDESLTYSSALFSTPSQCLEEAQRVKNRRIAEQLGIRKGDHILDIGCGWGSLTFYLALTYPCKVTCITISEEQFNYVDNQVKELGLEESVLPILTDFRDIKGDFDHIVSVELTDSLVQGDLPKFFEVCNRSLKPSGKLVLQCILGPENCLTDNHQGEWVQKYITPGALTPSLASLIKSANQFTDFHVMNLIEMGQDYSLTFSYWLDKFQKNRGLLSNLGYDETFLRTWEYYLAYAQAAYSMGAVSCSQITMARLSDLRI